MIKKYVKSGMIFLLILSILLSNFSFALSQNDENNQKKELKISDELLSQLDDNEKFYDIIIYFKEEADFEQIMKKSDEIYTQDSQDVKERKVVIGELQEVALLSQDKVKEYLDTEKEQGNVQEYTDFFIVNAINVIAKKSVVEKLNDFDNISSIELNGIIQREEPIKEDAPRRVFRSRADINEIEWNLKAINADMVWDKGIEGQGVVVGILDSAVDVEHPALKRKFRGYDENTGNIKYEGNYIDCVDSKTKPDSSIDVEHGTHCMGIVLGSQIDDRGNEFNIVGVAPKAEFISARVFGNNGQSTEAGFLKAAQWMLKPDGTAESAPHIINNSWGGAGGNFSSPWFQKPVLAWRNANILPVFSSGNKLPGEANPGAGSISTPANYKDSFAVGATDKNTNLAYFSKRGPSPFPDAKDYKPEVTAPGVTIRSSVRGGYMYMSGTSMAAPHVAGVAALIKSYKPDITEGELRELIKKTATPRTDENYQSYPNHGYGYGIVNALDAIKELEEVGNARIEGKVTSNSRPIKADITIKETNRFVKNDSSTGNYIIRHTAGDITIQCRAYGYEVVEKTINLKKDENQVIDFELIPREKGKLNIIVLDNENEAVEGAYVRIVEDSNVGVQSTDTAGKTNLEAYNGKYTLRVFKDGYEVSEKLIEINSDDKTLTINLISKQDDEYIEQELAYDTNQVNKYSEKNFVVGNRSGQFQGGAVRFDPTRTGGKIKNCEIFFFNDGIVANEKKARVGICKRDNRGRFSYILEPFEFEFTPGKSKIIPLEKYQIKTDEPYYILVLGSNEDPSAAFSISADGAGNKEHSFYFSDSNLIPISEKFDLGALMIRSTMIYHKNSQGIEVDIKSPTIDRINPGDEKITGKSEKSQRVQIEFPNGIKLEKVANDNGRFEFEVLRRLEAGDVLNCYAKDVNGLKSKVTKAVVLTDKTEFLYDIEMAENLIGSNTLQENQKRLLQEKLDIAKTLKIRVEDYEKATVESSEIIKLQKEITKTTEEIRNFILQLIPEKKNLKLEIDKIKEEIKEVWISDSDGIDVPNTKMWVNTLEMSRFKTKVDKATFEYRKHEVNADNIQRIIQNLKVEKEKFDNKKQVGKEETFVIDNNIRDGLYVGGYNQDATRKIKVTTEIKNGRIVAVKVEGLEDIDLNRVKEDGFFDRISAENKLDVKRTEKSRISCNLIIKAIIESLKKDPVKPKADVSSLIYAVEEVQKILDFYTVSVDGEDIDSDREWVSHENHNKLKMAIDSAKEFIEKDDITIEQVENQVKILEKAKDDFIKSLKFGKQKNNKIPSMPELKPIQKGDSVVSVILKENVSEGDYLVVEVVGKDEKRKEITQADLIGERIVHINLSAPLANGDTVKATITTKLGINSPTYQKTVEQEHENTDIQILSVENETKLNGTNYESAITIIGADNDTLDIRIDNLPEGISFDKSNMKISGQFDVIFDEFEEVKKFMSIVFAMDKTSMNRKLIVFTVLRDTDNDGIADIEDDDDDNDGFSDVEEIKQGSNPKDANSKPIVAEKETVKIDEIYEGAEKIIVRFYNNLQKARFILPDATIFEISKDLQGNWKASDDRVIKQEADKIEISVDKTKIVAGKKIYVTILENEKSTNTIILISGETPQQPKEKFTITLVGENITVSPNEREIEKGTNVKVMLNPPANHKIKTFVVNGVDKKAELVGNIYAFAVSENSVIKVEYEKIASSSGSGGSSGGSTGGGSSSGGSSGGGSGGSSGGSAVATKAVETKIKETSIKIPQRKMNVDISKIFTDISKDEKVNKAIKSMVERELMLGTSANKFEPNKELNRAMFVTILSRLSGEVVNREYGVKFSDINPNKWYFNSANWAFENKLVQGNEKGLFVADKKITAGEAALIIQRYIDYKKLDIKISNDKSIERDEMKVAISNMVQYGIFDKGNKDIQNKDKELTRAEIAQMLDNLINIIEDKK